MNEAALTRREAMVLRFIYDELKNKPIVGVKEVAEFLGVSLPTTFEVLNRLVEKKGLLRRIKRRGYILSEKGKVVAKKLIFTHRVVEYVFFRVFGMNTNSACMLATHIDYLIDISYAKEAFRFFNFPRRCPCNKEIPKLEGDWSEQ